MKVEIQEFAQEFEAFKAENKGCIAEIVSSIEIHVDALSELLDEYSDTLKDTLGAKLANEHSGEDLQEDAISQAEEWVADNVSNGSIEPRIAAVLWLEGVDKGKSILIKAAQGLTTKIRLVLDVTYQLNGESPEEAAARLSKMCERAIGSGLLTGDTAMQVEEYSMDAKVCPEPVAEDELADFMLSRIESNSLRLEDIPLLLARYGMREPNDFLEEMRERMQLD